MDYKNLIKEIVSSKTLSKKEKIDKLLKMDCSLYTNLGVESIKEEKDVVKQISDMIYKGIASIDEEVGKMIKPDR
jgi:transcription elongation factor Elf1